MQRAKCAVNNVHKHQFGHLWNGNQTFILPLWRGVQQVRFVALNLGKAVPKSGQAEPTSCCPPYWITWRRRLVTNRPFRTTILDKIKWNSKPPLSPAPNQGWSRGKGKNAPFSHLWFWGRGGQGFPFILSKIVGRCTTFLVKRSFICMRMKNDFHIKGWAPTLVLKQIARGNLEMAYLTRQKGFIFLLFYAWVAGREGPSLPRRRS